MRRKCYTRVSRRAWRIWLWSRDRIDVGVLNAHGQTLIAYPDVKLLERETHTCNSRTPHLNIQFGFPRIALSCFILFYFFERRTREREGREGHASILIASSYKTYSHLEPYRGIIVEGDAKANHRDGKREFTPIILVAFASRRCLRDFSKETMPIIINEP